MRRAEAAFMVWRYLSSPLYCFQWQVGKHIRGVNQYQVFGEYVLSNMIELC